MNTALLLLLFNRPETTHKLFQKLKIFKPKKIYINIDGPREKNLNDKKLCTEVEKITNDISWDCKVFKKINEKNKGCRSSVSEAINWFFQYENSGIILEDDCIPSSKFFEFCERMLKKFENNNQIKVVSGSNFHDNKKFGEGDYYFSKYAHCWGWATWKRAWLEYDDKMENWKEFKKSKNWEELHINFYERKYWTKIFDKVIKRKIDSWAYVWLYSVWYKNGITITPNFNMINNIGFGPDATHTFKSKNISIRQEILENSDIIKDPREIYVNRNADEIIFETHFNGKFNFWPWRIIYILKILIKDPITFWMKLKKKLLI